MTSDPTAKEMRDFLRKHPEADEFEIEEAIYWFAYENHRGQGSNLYYALSASEYSPGIARNRASGVARRLQSALESQFVRQPD